MVVLPNDKNVILAAEQAAKVAKATVRIVPTRNVAQGMAALVAFVPVALFGIIFSIARGNDVRVVEMVFNAIVAACGGLIGGVVAERSAAR